MFYVFDYEFEMIRSSASQSSLYLTFFGIVVGIAIALLITLLTVVITGPYTRASFILGFAGSLLATLILGLKALSEYRAAHRQIDLIEKQNQTSPILMRPFVPSSPYTQDSKQPEP